MKVSIKQVAELAGVSIATVSRCLNQPEQVKEATRAKVEKAIAETGYLPNALARDIRRGHTNIILVALPSIGDPFFTEVMAGLSSVADQHGFSIAINETEFNTLTAQEIGSILMSRQADGIILLASDFPFGSEALDLAGRRGQPIVIGCEAISEDLSRFPSVHIDNVAAAKEATDFLISQGHRKIAFIAGTRTSLLTVDRERGYLTAMREAGLEPEPGWVVEGKQNLAGAMEATRKLLEHAHRPTAIFCATDEMAIGSLHTVKSHGLSVPADISIMGFDDIRYAAVTDPPLTTIAQPARLIGERVAAQLVNAINNTSNQKAESEIVPYKLVVRQSVATRGA